MKLYIKYWGILLFLFPCIGCSQAYVYEGSCRLKTTYSAISICLKNELEKYSDKLSKLYKKYNTGGPGKELKKAEIFWVKFAKTDCEYIAYEVNKNGQYEVIYNACLINKIKARIKDLERSLFYGDWVLR